MVLVMRPTTSDVLVAVISPTYTNRMWTQLNNLPSITTKLKSPRRNVGAFREVDPIRLNKYPVRRQAVPCPVNDFADRAATCKSVKCRCDQPTFINNLFADGNSDCDGLHGYR